MTLRVRGTILTDPTKGDAQVPDIADTTVLMTLFGGKPIYRDKSI